jgi:hypothetical protein
VPVTPAFERLRQEDGVFKASQDSIARPCLKKQNNNKNRARNLNNAEFIESQVN